MRCRWASGIEHRPAQGIGPRRASSIGHKAYLITLENRYKYVGETQHFSRQQRKILSCVYRCPSTYSLSQQVEILDLKFEIEGLKD